MKHKALIVLESLLDGESVAVEGSVYHLGENNDLLVKAVTIKYDKGVEVDREDTWLGAVLGGCPLSYFIDLCESIPNSDILLISASNALRHTRRT